MRVHELKRHIANKWRKRWVRVTTALLALAVAIWAQYFVSRVPQGQNVEAAEAMYTPVKAKVKQQEIILAGPSLPSNGDLLLSFDGKKNQTVEFHATKAALSHDTLEFLQEVVRGSLSSPPSGFEKIDYSISENGNRGGKEDDTCRMFISVNLVENKMPSEIHFYQPEIGNDHFQTIEITAKGADLKVQLKQKNPESNIPEGNPWALGCGKILTVGNWTVPVPGESDFAFIVPANSTSRFTFHSLRESESLQPAGRSFEPFSLGEQSLQAQGVMIAGVLANENLERGSGVSAIEVRSEKGKPLLNINDLKETENEVLLDFSGIGLVKTNGKYAKTVSILELINQNPLLAGIFALGNAALLTWVGRAVFKSEGS